ncbi:MAG: cation:proton antiporter [Phycisphaerales bacterium]|nr:cation:proton antiporter [Phycisphaerales bacterium]
MTLPLELTPLGVLAMSSPAPGSQAGNITRDLVIMLIGSALMAMVLRRFKLATIPCFLITGALLGPTATGLISSGENISSISSLAVVLLMFTIGMHLNPSEIRGGGMIRALFVGVVSTLAVILVFWPLSAAATGSAPVGLALAMAIAMSSTAVAMRIVSDNRETHRSLGRMALAIAIAQDLLALGCMAMMPLLAVWAGVAPKSGDGGHPAFLLPADWPTAVKGVAGIVGIAVFILFGRLVLPRLVLEATRGASSEIALVLSAGAALLAAVVAAGLGFSPELGAFTAGFLLSSTSVRHQLAGQLSPLRDLFMAVFFTSVGLSLDFGSLRDGWMLVALGVIGLVVIKSFIIAATAWTLGATPTLAARSGLLLGQAGEFSIVVLGAAGAVGLVAPDTNSRIIAIAVISLILIPMLFKQLDRLQPLLSRMKPAGWTRQDVFAEQSSPSNGPASSIVTGRPGSRAASSAGTSDDNVVNGTPSHTHEHAHRPEARPAHVIIAGFGVVGRSLADRLDILDIPFIVVDMNQATIATQLKLGRKAVYGDVSNIEVLESAGLEHADAVMLTIPDDEATLRACQTVRSHNANVYIAARTGFLSRAMQAMQLGADIVVVEEVATAEAMAKQVIAGLTARAAARQKSAER